MRKSIIKCLALIISVLGSVEVYAQSESQLAHQILNNKKYQVVKEKGLELLKTGFNAGTVYKEVWSRDLNTFVAFSCVVMPHQEVREALLRFFYFQGFLYLKRLFTLCSVHLNEGVYLFFHQVGFGSLIVTNLDRRLKFFF